MNSTTREARRIYRSLTYKKVLLIVGLSIMILVSTLINLFVGNADLTLSETLKGLVMRADEVSNFVIWDLRMPVAFSAVFIGGALGIGGCEMQTVLRNPMASSYTLGLSSAASFGAALAIVLRISIVPGVGNLLVTLNSFVFSLIAAVLIHAFSRQKGSDRSTLILFGIALNFLFSALTQILQYVANESDLQSLVFWSFGSLTKVGWPKLWVIIIVTFFCLAYFGKNAWKLTAMALSDESAQSLGVDVQKTRRNTILVIAFLTATAVSFAGTIGFVGLVSPHIARILCGEDQRYFLVTSALVGSLLLSVASILSKTLVPGTLIPVGLVTSIIGIPFFVMLIFKKKKGYV